jgi:GntR family transcriptional regulator
MGTLRPAPTIESLLARPLGPVGPAAEEARLVLLKRIASGTLLPGQRLSAERDLAVELGVSRDTLRQALGSLKEIGLIRQAPGRAGGTFVCEAKIERDLSQVVSLPALLASQGVSARTLVLSTSLAVADDVTCAELGVDRGSLVFRLVRLRLADGDPISVERALLPASRFPGLLELPLGGSLYDLLDGHYGVRPGEAVERIEVVTASTDEAAILGVAVAAPLLSIVRTTRDEAGGPMEYSHDLFRGDRTRIVVRTPGRGEMSRSARSQGAVVQLQSVARPGGEGHGGEGTDVQRHSWAAG